MGKRVCIVFQETGEQGGKAFETFLEGLSPEALKMTTEEQLNKLSPADFWGLRMFQICAGMLRDSGVVVDVKRFH